MPGLTDTIDIYWFSGTGNTLVVARKMAEVFVEHGRTASLFPMIESDPTTVDTTHAIGLAFPVAEQGTYPFVWQFVKALPTVVAPAPVFMVDTLMLFSGGIVGPMRRVVKRKGYHPAGAVEIRMPNNLFPGRVDRTKVARIRTAGLEKAVRFARRLLDGDARWGRVPVISDAMGWFCEREWAWRLLRRYYGLHVRSDLCNGCGICAKLCPVGNIHVENGRASLGDSCYLCMRCVSFCPRHAIVRRSKAHEQYRTVTAGELTPTKE